MLQCSVESAAAIMQQQWGNRHGNKAQHTKADDMGAGQIEQVFSVTRWAPEERWNDLAPGITIQWDNMDSCDLIHSFTNYSFLLLCSKTSLLDIM